MYVTNMKESWEKCTKGVADIGRNRLVKIYLENSIVY